MENFRTYKYRFYYVEDEKRIPDGLLNANAFKNPDVSILSATKSRLAIFLYHYRHIINCINADMTKLYERTSDPKTPIDDLSEHLVQRGAVAIYDGVSYQVALHGLLYSLKSFLDVFSFFVAKYLKPEAKAISFGKGKVGAERISGGSFVNWLRNSKFHDFRNREVLADLIERQSRGWINQAIKYRDDLTHRTNIMNFKDMHVVLDHKRPYIKRENIIPPSMPDGTPLNEYAVGIFNALVDFVKNIVEMLPNVNVDLIYFDMSLADKGGTRIRVEYDGRDEK